MGGVWGRTTLQNSTPLKFGALERHPNRLAQRHARYCVRPPVTLKPVKLLRQILLILLLAAFTAALLTGANYITVPTGNTNATHFDAILVLGSPANLDGSPSPEERQRVLEAVREYRAGIAPRLILSGAAAHNQFIEAHVMAQFAQSLGVPAADLIEEPQALNTIQNIYYSARILHAHGWSSAEVVSAPYHLGRAALILAAFNRCQPALHLDWHTHTARWPPDYTFLQRCTFSAHEAIRCAWIRLFGFPDSRFLPRTLAAAQS